ncbi:prenyltransferase [Nesterenkonia halotolerans]|uniref:4-hydroxybenzoate polyprenyltransferase n=1 Tax=Nesterenkonia halotolerans TaxID=225325 RepID=A0ABR9J6I6_9MICC|nr:prenyltransferase [Nesterenkonia halotolerans]MBE1514605.1 4-hydroxybenzoate polyprenyltransferase [Nesterenkonia halotolerans]
MNLVRQLLLSSRPFSWINTAFPFAAAYLYAAREIDWVLILGALFFLVPYNVAMYGINDVFDYESDLRNPRKGGIEGALLAPALHAPVLWISALSTLPPALALMLGGGPATWAAMLVSLFAVAAYSVKGLRFKERPFLDSLTSSTHFVSPAVVGFALAHDRVGYDPGATVVLILAAFFLWGMAAHAFGAVQDVVPDREGGIASVATALGARFTVRMAVLLWAAAGVLLLLGQWPTPLAAVLVVPYIAISLPWFNVTDETSAGVNSAWRRFIWLNYACGFLATLMLIWVW